MDEIEYDREINGRGQKQRKHGGGKSYEFGTWLLGLLMKTISYLLSDFSGCTT